MNRIYRVIYELVPIIKQKWKEKQMKYFLGYEDYGAVYQLIEEEYKEMERALPQDLKIDE